MIRALTRCAVRVLSEVYRSLSLYGRVWLAIPVEHPLPTPAHQLERVRADVPLTPVEQALDRQLQDLDDRL